MGIDHAAKILLSPRQFDLGKDGVRVDVGQLPNLSVLLGARECTGDVDEKICRPYYLYAFFVGKAKPLRFLWEVLPPSAELRMVRPSICQPEARHEARKVLHVERAIVAYPDFYGVIGPLTCIFQVVDIVT